jgi:redox-sensitive bicupin YhaK (pirin superfamily)
MPQLTAGAELVLPSEQEELAFYVASGAVTVAQETIETGVMAVAGVGEALSLRASRDSRVMVIGGANIGPRIIEWNFVSDSQERIDQAKQDWRDNKFAGVPGDQEFISLP